MKFTFNFSREAQNVKMWKDQKSSKKFNIRWLWTGRIVKPPNCTHKVKTHKEWVSKQILMGAPQFHIPQFYTKNPSVPHQKPLGSTPSIPHRKPLSSTHPSVPHTLVLTWGVFVGLSWRWNWGVLVFNWGILGAEKVWSLCGSDVLK